MRMNNNYYYKYLIMLVLLCFVLQPLTGCSVGTYKEGAEANPITIYSLREPHSTYGGVLAEILPNYGLGDTANLYPSYQQPNTVAVEASDVHVLPAIEYGVLGYWYPHYLATVVIAIDRDRTDAQILGWNDLSSLGEPVGIIGYDISHLLFSAIAYGLEGENYTLNSATTLMAGLRENGFFRSESADPAVIICYDSQAAAMKKAGRALDIVVPCEGTLTYVRGLFSHDELSFSSDLDPLLLRSGLRLRDGRCDETLYPAPEAYETATTIPNYNHFNAVSVEGDRVYRRDVRNTRLYSSVDAREHQLYPLLYIVVLVLWTSSVFRRAMHRSVRRSSLIMGITMFCWMTTRIIKYQIADESTLGLYLWYSYILFQLTLPLVALYLAHSIDRPDDNTRPWWLYACSALNVGLVLLTFTTHLHGMVYIIDFTNPRWANVYGYGPSYTLIQVLNYGMLGLAVMVMLVKCWRSSRKRSIVFPAFFLIFLVIYAFAYSAYIPIARDSDITMVTGLISLLFFESALRTGLIPVNTRYRSFFANSTLGMQLIDHAGETMLSSASAVELDAFDVQAVLASSPLPHAMDNNTLLFAGDIRGGHVLWQEDISRLNHLHAEIDESVSRLSAANAALAEEEKIKRLLTEEREKERLTTQLDAEIAEYTAQLSEMAQQLEQADDQPHKAAEIAILLCYVKRRCNLFFREQEVNTMPPSELTGYLDELAGIAAYSNKVVSISSDVNEPLSIRKATLLYDFFYRVLNWAAQQSHPHVIGHLRTRNDTIIMRLLPYAKPKGFTLDDKFMAAIGSIGGLCSIEILDDDAAAISLSFPLGGDCID